MSSSRRSSRSSRSLRPPAWSISKNSAPTELSLVFAEPEQVPRLAPATSSLARRASLVSIHSDPAPKLQDLFEESIPSQSVAHSEPIIEPQPPMAEAIKEELEVEPAQPELVPANEPVPFPTAESPVRHSWFGSLGRAKGKRMAVSEPVLPQESFPSLPPVDSLPQPIPSPSKKRSVTTPTSPSPLSTSVPSSLDEEVPQIQHIEQSETNSVVLPPRKDDTVRVRLNSLNPSTSRFTISLPLLGRPKVPLDQAMRGDAGPATNETQPITVEQTPEPEASAPSATEQLQQLQETSTDLNTETVRTPRHESRPSNSSWWDYVGWSSTQPQSADDHAVASDSDSTVKNTITSETPLPPPTEPADTPVPAVPTEAVDPAPAPAENPSDETRTDTPLKEKAAPRAASILSAETSKTQGSSWYAPWAWYGSTTTAAEDNSKPSAETGKTESELVKEEALARDTQASALTASTSEPAFEPPPPPTPPPAESQTKEPETRNETNPLESSFSTYTSAWSSFFSSSSRRLVTKTITNEGPQDVKRDENGVEIMEVPDDVGEGGAPSTQQGEVKEGAKPSEAIVIKGKDKKQPTTTSTSSSAVSLLLPAVLKTKEPPASPTKPESVSDKEDKDKPAAPPLTISDSIKQSVKKSNNQKEKETQKRATKPSSSSSKKGSGTNTPRPKTPPPNLVLPNWEDTFHTPPRSIVPPSPSSKLGRTMKFVSGVLFSTDTPASVRGKKEREYLHFGKELPRSFDILEKDKGKSKEGSSGLRDVLRGCTRVVVIGIHGWFPGAVMRSVLGEPTGTSSKFVTMMVQALEEFQKEYNVKLEKITPIPLEGEGTIGHRAQKLYANLLGNQQWIDDLHAADVIFVATHSQGSVVSTHLLDQLIRDKHIRTSRDIATEPFSGPNLTVPAMNKPQRICCLALCGIHLGPLRYLSSSSLLQPYIQYFESTAAKELFEFQNTENEVSKAYVKALRNVLDHGTKMVYVASLNDQVVPIYSGLFTAASHPLILRALYIDGDAYHSSDFLSNLLILLLRILNSGLSDSGLITHLSEATAGSLNGVGHSTAYEELATYMLAVKYLFLSNDGLDAPSELKLEPFNANTEQNDYEIPWSLRDLVADESVAHFFSSEITKLRDAFRDWHPKTTILRDIKRKLQPIQKLSSSNSSLSTLSHTSSASSPTSASKL